MSGRNLTASKSRTKSSCDYIRRRAQVEQQLLAKQAELQQAEVELHEASELLRVRESLWAEFDDNICF